MTTPLSYKPIIEAFLSQNVDDENEWERLEETIQPPLHFMQSYIRNTKEFLTVRSTVLVPFKLGVFVDLFQDVVKFMSAYPNVWDVKKIDDDRLSFTLVMNATDYVGRVYCRYKHIVEHKRTILFSYDYQLPGFIYYIHCAEKMRDGIMYTLETKSLNAGFGRKEILYAISTCRKNLHQMVEFMKKDRNEIFMLANERLFNQKLQEDKTTLIPVHRTNLFTLFTNKDKTELFAQGKTFFNFNLKTLVNMYSGNTIHSPLCRTVKTLRDDGLVNYLHVSTGMLGKIRGESDIFVGTILFEGNMFVFSETLCPQKECDIKHNTKIDMQTGEHVEWFGEFATTTYYYKFFIPELKNTTPQMFKTICNNFLCAFLLIRIRLEGISPALPFCSGPTDDILEKRILQTALLKSYNYTLLKRQNKITRKQIEDTHPTNCFDELDNESIITVFQFLPLQSVVAMMRTSKRMYSIIKNNEQIWGNFYTLYFKPTSFCTYTKKCTEFCTAQINAEKMERNKLKNQSQTNYYLVKHACTIKNKWTLNRPKQRMSARLVQMPIHFIEYCPNRTILVGNNTGCVLRVGTDNKTVITRTILSNEITGISQYDNCAVVSFKKGEMRKYKLFAVNDFQTFPALKNDHIQFLPDQKYLSWCTNSQNFSLADFLDVSRAITYKVKKDLLLQVQTFSQNLVVCSTSNNSNVLFDLREGDVVFETLSQISPINTFDCFDWYVVSGCQSGSVWMFDLRKQGNFLNRTIHTAPINVVKCFNRKIVTGGDDHLLSLLECNKSWCGGLKYMYQHQSPITSIEMDDTILMSGSADGYLWSSFYE
ncbi:hypothetical protein EIN_034170 [Entamoeba invadens IP1]|uniref:F-box domain-containing protein n=1 Tax=Entamoeba invadens IP1 TaxID=370355 RepID=A0A0A1U487_ENTIV|nr:hypothetical protein EIN_034170 [Entamoeba invadens IP1]ELP86506.1 hypothetical protein EIN_034170 [Entamoeba invadens IP1]|eukprot:XP_004185852.1 hypothetical protein EIN_034170 [Entamoeba invadens IP1]